MVYGILIMERSSYGLETSLANQNPNYRIDKPAVNTSSDMADRLVVLEYVSDGLEREMMTRL